MDFNKLDLKGATVLYFTSSGCQVCNILKPRAKKLLAEKFPKIKLYFIDIDSFPLLAGKYQIYTVPVVLILFEGKEFYRKVRNISIAELEKEIERPYRLFFE